MLLHTLAGIAWDPQIRGFLAFGVGVVTLIGSVYLLLITNLGVRLGFMIAAAAIFGWLTIMGGIWWAYGSIGMLGDINRWEVKEIVYPGLQDAGLSEAHQLDTSQLPEHEELNTLTDEELSAQRKDLEAPLGGWRLLPESNASFGEAKATVDEYFAEHKIPALGIAGATDYVSIYSFERGGKSRLPEDPSRIDRLVRKLKTTFVELRHPPHYAIIQIQPVVKVVAEPGQPPPTPEADPAQPVVSVIMERNLGDRRFPGAMLCLSSGIMFAVLCVQLHRRDQRVAEVRGLLPATTEG
ncbi:MAG: hypothetical protein ACT4OV_06130 [Microthrixaceae bacterium]